MTTYFSVTVEQLKQYCKYDKNTNSYEYEMIFARQYPPFAEVINYSRNADGTITLYVDAVWPDYNSDVAFTNILMIEPHEDGSFRYLSNHVEEKELDIPIVE